jgi:hypothetical protein
MKYALITGASSGIGFELAKVFAQHGHHLILTARSEDKLLELQKHVETGFQIKAEVIVEDLSQPQGAQRLFQEVNKRGLEVGILVNNAGFGSHGLFQNSDLKRQKEMIQLNITSLMELTHLFLPAMLKSGSGKILNLASTASFLPGPFMSVYYASKAFVLSFSEGLSEELKGTGVSVTAVCPGITDTGFQAVANIQNVPILKSAPAASSHQVAVFAYQALMRNQTVAIEGFMNRMMNFMIRLTPRFAVRQAIMSLQKSRQHH